VETVEVDWELSVDLTGSLGSSVEFLPSEIPEREYSSENQRQTQ
jgi:hypothetical protein